MPKLVTVEPLLSVVTSRLPLTNELLDNVTRPPLVTERPSPLFSIKQLNISAPAAFTFIPKLLFRLATLCESAPVTTLPPVASKSNPFTELPETGKITLHDGMTGDEFDAVGHLKQFLARDVLKLD